MLYSDVRANQFTGTMIGRLYMNAPEDITCMARRAYDAFIQQTAEQWEVVRRSVNVIFQDDDPYDNDAARMFDDINARRTLRVYKTGEGQDHPYMTRGQNNIFRAVHDFNGHYGAGTGFDRHGEEGAWMRHSQMYTGLARRAMTTETRGQSSAFIWIMGGGENFPPQKAILLPEWVSES